MLSYTWLVWWSDDCDISEKQIKLSLIARLNCWGHYFFYFYYCFLSEVYALFIEPDCNTNWKSNTPNRRVLNVIYGCETTFYSENSKIKTTQWYCNEMSSFFFLYGNFVTAIFLIKCLPTLPTWHILFIVFPLYQFYWRQYSCILVYCVRADCTFFPLEIHKYFIVVYAFVKCNIRQQFSSVGCVGSGDFDKYFPA